MNVRALTLLLAITTATSLSAQASREPIDTTMNRRIRTEGMEHSRIMWAEHFLADVYGPRPTGSPNHVAAANWAVKTMTAWGLKNAHLEPFTWHGVGWLPGRASGYITSPVTANLRFEARPWSPATRGTVRGNVLVIVAPLNPTEQEMQSFLLSMVHRVRNGIVMFGPPPDWPVNFGVLSTRMADDSMRAKYQRDTGAPPAGRGGGNRGRGGNPAPGVNGTLSPQQVTARINTLLRDNPPALSLTFAGDARRIPGAIVAQNIAGQIYDDVTPQNPTAILRTEDYGRIYRIALDGTPVGVEFNIQNRFYPEGKTSYIAVGDIPGSDKADEVVMLGGHLDSWTSATGASDNAIGSAIMMEAARILQTLDARPRRTIRVALWSGEEMGLLGSQAYVLDHFGSVENPKPDFNKLQAYWNIDDGTGLVRGASIFGPPAAAAILSQIVKPFEDLGIFGAIATNVRSLGGSDDGAFAINGLPGIGTEQDPIDFAATTWHTNLDTYERIIPADAMKNAVISASLVYHLANRDALLPRLTADQMPARGGRGNAAGAGGAPIAMAHVFGTAKGVPLKKRLFDLPAPGATAVAMTAAAGATKAAHGSVVLRADGSFTYTPKAGYVGTDTFSYTVTRGGQVSTEGMVTIAVR